MSCVSSRAAASRLQAVLPSEHRTAGDLLLELPGLIFRDARAGKLFTTQELGPCCCGVPAEVGLFGPDTRRERRRFDLRKVRFKRAAMRVERAHGSPRPSKEPPLVHEWLLRDG